jgi:hypothetical protein
LIVHLPREGVLITGDLAVWPIPLSRLDVIPGRLQCHDGEAARCASQHHNPRTRAGDA